MGLAGLYGFVSKHPDLFTEYRLRDTKLVIDGLGLLRYLYDKLDSRFGGEYPEYHRRCTNFFDNLRQCDITAYVVFDGAWDLDDRKYKTYLSRHQQKLKTAEAVSYERGWQKRATLIPVFALHILQDVAAKKDGVFTVTTDFEADDEIVALANHFDCPVLALDNDFYIYPLSKGYIPFLKLNWQNVETMIQKEEGAKRQRSEYLVCSIFASQDKLCKNLGITKDKLFLLATIRGNDYLVMDTLKPFHEQIKLPYGGKALGILGNWMEARRDKTVDEILGEVLDMLNLTEDKRKQVEKLAKESLQVYSGASGGYLIDVFAEQKIDETQTMAKEKSLTSAHSSAEEEASTSAQTTTQKIAQPSMSAQKDRGKDYTSAKTSASTVPDDLSTTKSTSLKETTTCYEQLGLPVEMIQHLRRGTLHSMWVNVFAKGEFISLKQVENFHDCSANDISKDIRAAVYGILLGGGKFKTVKEYDRETRSNKAAEKDVEVPQEIQQYGKLPSLDALHELSQEERKKLILATLNQTEPILDVDDQLQLPVAVTKYWFNKLGCNDYIARGLVIGFLLYSGDHKFEAFSEQLVDLDRAITRVRHAYAQWQSCLIYANDLNVLLNYPLPRFDIAKLFSGKKCQQLAELASKEDVFNKTVDSMSSLKDRYTKLWNFVSGRL